MRTLEVETPVTSVFKADSKDLHFLEESDRGAIPFVRSAVNEEQANALPAVQETLTIHGEPRPVRIYSKDQVSKILGFPTPDIESLDFVFEDGTGKTTRQVHPASVELAIQITYNGENIGDGTEEQKMSKGIQTYLVVNGGLLRMSRRHTPDQVHLDSSLPRQVVLTPLTHKEHKLVSRQALHATTTHIQAQRKQNANRG